MLQGSLKQVPPNITIHNQTPAHYCMGPLNVSVSLSFKEKEACIEGLKNVKIAYLFNHDTELAFV